jgi:hypothetical protein
MLLNRQEGKIVSPATDITFLKDRRMREAGRRRETDTTENEKKSKIEEGSSKDRKL